MFMASLHIRPQKGIFWLGEFKFLSLLGTIYNG